MEPGNKASPGIVYSALVLTREAWNEASPRIVLRTGAHQGSLGTRRAQGLYTAHWCSPGEPENKDCPGIVYSALVLSKRAWNEGSLGLVLHTGAHRSHLANLELLLSSLLEHLLVLSRGPWNEGSLGLVLLTGAHRFNSANLELLVSPSLERLIFQFCQTEVMSLE